MTTLKEVPKQEDCNQIIQGMYIDMLEFFESTSKPLVADLEIKETNVELVPLVRYIPAKGLENNMDKLAILISSGVKAIAREFEIKYVELLTKDSKLVCNGLGTGGLQIIELPNSKVRIRWYIGTVV